MTVYDRVDNGNALRYKLREPIEAGETVYLYRESRDSPGQMSRGSRPDSASPTRFTDRADMWALRGNVEYFGVLRL